MLKKKIALTLALALMANLPAYAAPVKQFSPSTTPVLTTPQYNELTGEIVEINDKQITISPNGSTNPMDFIVLNLSGDTKFENCKLSALTVGNTIKVNHSPAMTRSLPPQTAAFKITLVNEAEQTFTYKGTVNEITYYKDTAMINVSSSNPKENNKEIIFTVSNDTKWNGGKLADLKKGSELTVTYGMVMTMSLPPQTAALSITVEKEAEKTFTYTGTVTEINYYNGNASVHVTTGNTNEANSEIVFNLSKNTVWTGGKLTDLKVGSRIAVTYGMAMTMSIPPQTTALSVTFDRSNIIEKPVVNTGSIEGVITHATDMKDFMLIRVVGKGSGKNAQSMVLIVTNKTELEDCKLKDLRAGKKVEVEFKSLEKLSKLSIAEATEIEMD